MHRFLKAKWGWESFYERERKNMLFLDSGKALGERRGFLLRYRGILRWSANPYRGEGSNKFMSSAWLSCFFLCPLLVHSWWSFPQENFRLSLLLRCMAWGCFVLHLGRWDLLLKASCNLLFVHLFCPLPLWDSVLENGMVRLPCSLSPLQSILTPSLEQLQHGNTFPPDNTFPLLEHEITAFFLDVCR